MKYFVWIKTNGRYAPQLWAIDFSNSIEKNLYNVVFKHTILEEEKELRLDDFIRKYPHEKVAIVDNAANS